MVGTAPTKVCGGVYRPVRMVNPWWWNTGNHIVFLKWIKIPNVLLLCNYRAFGWTSDTDVHCDGEGHERTRWAKTTLSNYSNISPPPPIFPKYIYIIRSWRHPSRFGKVWWYTCVRRGCIRIIRIIPITETCQLCWTCSMGTTAHRCSLLLLE